MFGFLRKVAYVAACELGYKPRTEPTAAYGTIDLQINQLYEMFTGASTWGCELVKNIVRYKRAHVLGHGVGVVPSGVVDSADDEIALVELFMDKRGLNEGRHKEFVTGAELEGCVLVKIEEGTVLDEKEQEVFCPVLKYFPKKAAAYELTADPEDSSKPAHVKMSYKVGGQEIKYDEDFAENGWAYVAFNALPGDLVGRPSMASVLRNMENLSESLTQWHRMNRNCAHSLPVVECEGTQEIKTAQAKLEEHGWETGKALITNGKVKILQGSGGDYLSMRYEIEANAKIISAAVDVPIHHLGFADVLSNRATADNLDEPIEAISGSDETLWKGFYERIFAEVIRLAKASKNGPNANLNPDAVKPDTTGIGASDYQRFKDIWLPAYEKGVISRQTALEKAPTIDAQREIERIDEERQSDQQRAATPFADAKADTGDGEGDEEGTGDAE